MAEVPLTLPPSVNAVAEKEIAETPPIPSETFGLPEAVLFVLNKVLGYIYSYLKKRLALYVILRMAKRIYGNLKNEHKAMVNDKVAFIQETKDHVQAKINEAFASSDETTKGYVPEVVVLMLNSIQQGFAIVDAEIENQITNVGNIAVKATGKILNFLFTSDLTIKQVGWRKGAPMSARMMAIYGEYWNQATGLTSNLISGLAYSDAIDTIHIDKSIKEKSELLYKMTHPEEFGAEPDQAPRRHVKPYLLMTPEEINDILKITLIAKANNKNYEGSEEVFSRNVNEVVRTTGLSADRITFLKRLFFGIREKGDIHFFYKFDPGFLHHGVILTAGLCVEVQNRVFEPTKETTKRVRAVVTPSSILDVLQRAKKVGLYGFDYENAFTTDTIKQRALWTIGKWDYDLFYNNCEHHTTWVFSNKLASEQCTRMEQAVLTLGEEDPRVLSVNTEQPPAWLQAVREGRGNAVPSSAPGSAPPSSTLTLPPIKEAVSVAPTVKKATRLPHYMQPTFASTMQTQAMGPKSLYHTNLGTAAFKRGGNKKTRQTRKRRNT